MKNSFKISLFVMLSMLAFMFGKANEGQELFSKMCAPCHSIGKGKLLGPDLKDITEKRAQDWLIPYIQSSQTLIKNGDPDAIASYKEFNNLVMPDQPLDDRQVKAILKYIDETGAGSTGVDDQEPVVDYLANATKEHVADGRLLFTGNKRLVNDGASCISCHHVKDDLAFSHGTLAKELTETYGLMGGAGMSAILQNPPFPTMSETYSKNSLTEEEVFAITAYLKSVNDQRANQNPTDFGYIFTLFGIIVFLLILVAIASLFFRRKKKSVNYEILSRQSSITN